MLFEELLALSDPEPHGAALNMAIDEVLLRTATTPLLRVYRWARPAVSFGYFGKYAEVERACPGREHVRRWTGGGIVPHGCDLTYTLIAPRACRFFALSAAESYRVIHECIGDVLGDGVALAADAEAKVSDACFENAARHDLLAGALKIAGAAQRRTRAGLLHQGSIQLPDLPDDFAARLAAALSGRIEHRGLSAAEIAAAHALSEEKYTSEAWLRRR